MGTAHHFFPYALFLLTAVRPIASQISTDPGQGPSWPILPWRNNIKDELVADPTIPITFNEFDINTRITDQYAETKGVIFDAEDAPFTTIDRGNPSSPVLSGTPRFLGDISGSFVDQDGSSTVKSFALDAGYFNDEGSTRLQWFDPLGNVLGQVTNAGSGIENLRGEGGNIASWRIGTFEDEPAGYAIDNFVSQPVRSSILFREKASDAKDGSWGFQEDDIPGFDHVALNFEDSVYEAHPGYENGTYQSSGDESVDIRFVDGVQNQFTKATFKHASVTAETDVVKVEEIGISDDDALAMKNVIDTVVGSAQFQFIDLSKEGVQQTLLPTVQKGEDNTFTGVGLIEWAAEVAGINGGQGFIPDELESIVVDNATFTLLSPQLLYWAMQAEKLIAEAKQFLKGFFGQTDFIITDPLGRRLGTAAGVRYDEIPQSFLSKDGGLEYAIIVNPLPGKYSVELFGAEGQEGMVALDNGNTTKAVGDEESESCKETVELSVTSGSRGDVNLDGVINDDDASAISAEIPVFTDGFDDPGDLNGDGVLDSDDVDILNQYLATQPVDDASSCPAFVYDDDEPQQQLVCDALGEIAMFRLRVVDDCTDMCIPRTRIGFMRLRGWSRGTC